MLWAKGGGTKGGAPKTVPPVVNYVDTMLAKYDIDHDGQLEKEEMHQMWLNDHDLCVEALKFDTAHTLALDANEVAAWKDFAKAKLAAAAAAAAAKPAGNATTASP